MDMPKVESKYCEGGFKNGISINFKVLHGTQKKSIDHDHPCLRHPPEMIGTGSPNFRRGLKGGIKLSTHFKAQY